MPRLRSVISFGDGAADVNAARARATATTVSLRIRCRSATIAPSSVATPPTANETRVPKVSATQPTTGPPMGVLPRKTIA